MSVERAFVLAAIVAVGCETRDVIADPEPPPNPSVATVEVAPATSSIDIGESLPLTATARDSTGTVLAGRPITWTSNMESVAPVTGGGVVTGTAQGAATITATSEGESGSASVLVSAPDSGQTLFVDGFESGTLGESGRWQDIVGSGPSIVVAADEGIDAKEGTGVMRMAAPGGAVTHFVATGAGPGHERLYLRYWLFRSSGYEASNGGLRAGGIRGSVTQWGSFGVGWGAPGGCPDDPDNIKRQEFMFAYAVNDGAAWGQRIYTQWLDQQKLQQDPPLCGGNYAMSGNPPATYVDPSFAPTANTWHMYEIETVVNTPGESDGSTRIWVDGVLRVAHLGVRYRTTSSLTLWAITFDSGTLSAEAYYVDDVVVRTRRP